jgi:primosomal protein N'
MSCNLCGKALVSLEDFDRGICHYCHHLGGLWMLACEECFEASLNGERSGNGLAVLIEAYIFAPYFSR